MSISATQSRFLVSPEHVMAGGGSLIPGRGTAAASNGRIDEDRSPAEVTAVRMPEGGELGFADLIDVLNPLQHIPVVGDLYRSLTGDTIQPAARIAGGTLYGGVLGFAASLANAAIEEISGMDVGQHVLAMFDDDPAEAPTRLAGSPPAAGAAYSASNLADIAPAAGSALPAAARPAVPAPAAAAPAALSAAPEQPAALPFLNPNPQVPQLSGAAFEALVDSFGPQAAPAPAAASPAQPARPVSATAGSSVPQVSMDVHNLLKGYADRAAAAPAGS